MPITSDHDMSLNSIKLLLVGPIGSGKTTGGGSFYKVGATDSRPSTIFIYDWDNRTKPLNKMFPGVPIEYESFSVSDFPRFKDHLCSLAEAIVTDSIDPHLRRFPSGPFTPPLTIMIDSLTFLADAVMQYLISFRGASGKKNPDSTPKGDVRRMGVIDIPAMPEWLGESMGMTQIFAITQSLPCNVILTAHYTTSVDVAAAPTGSGEGRIGSISRKTVITVGSKIAQKIPGQFNEIWSCYSRQGINAEDPLGFYARTYPYGDEMGRTCLNLPDEICFTAPANLYDAATAALMEQSGV